MGAEATLDLFGEAPVCESARRTAPQVIEAAGDHRREPRVAASVIQTVQLLAELGRSSHRGFRQPGDDGQRA